MFSCCSQTTSRSTWITAVEANRDTQNGGGRSLAPSPATDPTSLSLVGHYRSRGTETRLLTPDNPGDRSVCCVARYHCSTGHVAGLTGHVLQPASGSLQSCKISMEINRVEVPVRCLRPGYHDLCGKLSEPKDRLA